MDTNRALSKKEIILYAIGIIFSFFTFVTLPENVNINSTIFLIGFLNVLLLSCHVLVENINKIVKASLFFLNVCIFTLVFFMLQSILVVYSPGKEDTYTTEILQKHFIRKTSYCNYNINWIDFNSEKWVSSCVSKEKYNEIKKDDKIKVTTKYNLFGTIIKKVEY